MLVNEDAEDEKRQADLEEIAFRDLKRWFEDEATDDEFHDYMTELFWSREP